MNSVNKLTLLSQCDGEPVNTVSPWTFPPAVFPGAAGGWRRTPDSTITSCKVCSTHPPPPPRSTYSSRSLVLQPNSASLIFYTTRPGCSTPCGQQGAVDAHCCLLPSLPPVFICVSVSPHLTSSLPPHPNQYSSRTPTSTPNQQCFPCKIHELYH